jgi:pSer/pThr/pTyr-binding forkhead associated (FHA) protein
LRSMEKILEGDLSCFEVPDLLTFLNLGRRTGALVMERPDYETKLYLRDGRPVFATSTAEPLRFGTMLVKMGKLSETEMERIAGKQRGARIGQLLLQEKVLQEEELAVLLKVQVSEVIFDTFDWHDGEFTFYDRVPPPATAVTLEMDVHNLIMEGVRRSEDRENASAAPLPDHNMVVEALLNPQRVKQRFTLLPEEWQVFFLVDGRRSVNEILRLVGNGDEQQTLRILNRLKMAKIVGFTDAAAAEAEAASNEPRPVESGSTVKWVDGSPSPPEARPSVEFMSDLPQQRKVEDDTQRIVNRQARAYLADVETVTVSRLVLIKEDGTEASFPLIRDSYTLGRHRNNDIVISDPKASSFHARIDRSPEGFVLVDLKSRNGSWLNGKRVETALLKTGDELRLGMGRLVYKVDYTSAR